jgi:succinoglycan biosynthesis protein ExoM
MSYPLEIDVCVCTFRRLHVAETLRSISKLVVNPNWIVRVIVADNDESPSARNIVKAAANEYPLSLTYLHAPARNISVARNACLGAATAALVAFIDDDEIASPEWLAALVATLEVGSADVVLGPTQAVYQSDSPAWMRKGDFHSTKPVWVGGEIRTGYTCNVLFKRIAPALNGRRFRVDLGTSGGEDTIFFSEVHRAGGRIDYAEKALVTELVAADRSNLSWLLRRRFRFGRTLGLLLAEDGTTGIVGRFNKVGMASAKAGMCFLTACLNLARGDRWRFWMLRGTMHSGAVFRLLRPDQYVQPLARREQQKSYQRWTSSIITGRRMA